MSTVKPVGTSFHRPQCIGYLRVSKERKATGSFTFETQRERIIEYLDRKYGAGNYDISFFKDDGLSGGYAMSPTGMQPKVRPTLRKIADLVESRTYEAVFVYGQSRLFRNARGMMELVEDILLPNNTPLFSATEEIDIFTADGRMMLYMKALFDEKNRTDIIKRNKDAAATRAEQGYAIGQPGYGWGWEPLSNNSKRRGIVAIEEEKFWVLHIKERYLGGSNAIKIAGELNEMGVPSPLQRELWTSKARKLRTRDGREPRWTNGTVWDVLKNPLHAGLIKLPSGERIQGQHFEQRFWEPEELELIEKLREERGRRFKTVTGQKNTPHLLNGIITCARCGTRLYMSSSSPSTKNYLSYKCTNGVQEGQPTCRGMVVRAEWVEKAVVEEIGAMAQSPRMRRLLEAEARGAVGKQDESLLKERTKLRAKLESCREKFERWAEGYSQGIMSAENFKRYSQTLESEEREGSARLAEIDKQLESRASRELWLQQVKQQFENFPLVWEELSNDEKRQVLDYLIEEGGLRADRDERDIKLKIKLHLLPEKERTIPYRTYRGINRTNATGLQRLTLRQMVLLHHAGQGKTRKECAELMGVKVHSVITVENTIRKNLGGVTWAEAIDMARGRVHANLHQLPLDSHGKAGGKQSAGNEKVARFLSPVLMEVFELFAKGATVPEVAERLELSVTTVQGRRARILKLYGTSSMLEAVEMARAARLL